MRIRSKTICRFFVAALFLLLLGLAVEGTAQTTKPAPNYPTHLPYSFGNFVWWSDDELRALLKKRIPGLGDEIETTSVAVGRMRDALKALLKEKGISVDIYSEEPSYFGSARDPEAPAPSIQFSILNPQILLNKIAWKVEPENLAALLQADAHWGEEKPDSAFGDWFRRSRIKEVLHQNGYLDARVQISRQPPVRDGNHYQVSLAVSVIAGPQYHVSTITADGGPLLTGRDLSRFYGMKEGDVPGRYPLADLESKLREFYLHYGYADVEIKNQAVLDRVHVTVSYHLDVIPGPVYHLRRITVENLDAKQESKVREMIGMKPGEIYLDEAVMNLYHKIADEPLLKGYSFGFGPKRDNTANVIDLTLSFHKEGGESGESSVTIK
jgi:outer membrane protein assembly factor BamA